MNDYAFYQCKQFLEQHIDALPDNTELIKAYVSLIEQKTKFDIALCSQNAEVQKNWNNNQMEMNKQWQSSQAEITKTQIQSVTSNTTGAF